MPLRECLKVVLGAAKWFIKTLNEINKKTFRGSSYTELFYIDFRVWNYMHCLKSVRIRSFSGPYFPAFELNTEIYRVNLCIWSECGKIRTRKLHIRTLFTCDVHWCSAEYRICFENFVNISGKLQWQEFPKIKTVVECQLMY